jgi:transposase-like protein
MVSERRTRLPAIPRRQANALDAPAVAAEEGRMNAAAENRWVREARERGHKAFRDGTPYTHCPYLTFPDCAEGKAWQNGWLAEKEKTK